MIGTYNIDFTVSYKLTAYNHCCHLVIEVHSKDHKVEEVA